MRLRIDVRTVTGEWLARTIQVVRGLKREIHAPDGRRVVSGEEFGRAVAATPAWRFVKDPAAFLERVRIGGPQAG